MEAAAFVERYRATWEAVMQGRAGIEALRPFFNLPCLMLARDGAVEETRTAAEVDAFNAARRDAFAAGGAVRATTPGVRPLARGPASAVAEVDWELLRKDGSTERAWTHCYTIRLSGAAPAILVSAFGAGS